jgi:hypothetical protein
MRILMTRARVPGVIALLAVAISAAACSSPASPANSASQPSGANTTTSAATAAAATGSAGSSASPSATGVANLVLTDAIRAQLVAAAAKLNGLPATAYVDLVHGESYYGFDPATSTYWAGGALDPSPSSQRAQVSVQDDGGYYVFEKPAGGSWTASAVGLAGTEGASCPVHVPPALVALWQWPAGGCHPAGI